MAPVVAERVVTLMLACPPGATTHWTAATMAEQLGIVQRIWRAHGLQRVSPPGVRYRGRVVGMPLE